MYDIKVKSDNDQYNIILGDNILSEVQSYIDDGSFSKIFILTEHKIYKLWKEYIHEVFGNDCIVIKVESGEASKSISCVEVVCRELSLNEADRNSVLVNIGGGMISDLGGFVAACYIRGIASINVPTSLLAMIDASIGGKTAINSNSIKNIIGFFKSPNLVLIDTKFLSTLPQRELISGKSEMIKHTLIKDHESFFELLNVNFNSPIELVVAIKKSLDIKKYFVENDFLEKNIRKLLNLGHTVGHAFEAASLIHDKSPLLHGEAIAIGIVVEAKISESIGILASNDCQTIIEAIYGLGFTQLFVNKIKYNIDELIQFMLKDKKNQNHQIRMSVPTKIGGAIYDINIPQKEVIEVLKSYFSN